MQFHYQLIFSFNYFKFHNLKFQQVILIINLHLFLTIATIKNLVFWKAKLFLINYFSIKRSFNKISYILINLYKINNKMYVNNNNQCIIYDEFIN